MNIVTATAERVAAGPAGDMAPWQASLRRAVRDSGELIRRLGLDATSGEGAAAASRSFPTFVPLEYLARIRSGDPDDPLLRQVLPVADELETPEGYSADPLAEADAVVTDGVLQKYAGRVLLVTTGACAVHCRYCFRRHFPYEEVPGAISRWEPALEAIAADTSIHEVILSGGDPLMLSDARLAELVSRIESIEHIKRLRIHTRLPIMIPSRVTEGLVGMLRDLRLVSLVVVHANHAAEIDEAVASSLARLVDAGVPVLNQSVLLRGVNDDVEALAALSDRLLECRVMPYYLHQLDRVLGAAHFEVSKERGKELVAEMCARLPGYAVPRFVEEVPGELNKTVID